MKKRCSTVTVVKIAVLLLFLLLPSVVFGARYRNLRITYQGKYRFVRLYIYGRSYGRIYRNSTRVIRMRAGRPYLIRLKKGRRQVRRRVYLSRTRDKRVVFLNPSIRAISKRGVMIFVLEGRYQRAKLYINGRRRGWVHRDEPRKIVLRTGRKYVVQARRRGRIRTRHIYLGMTPRARRRRVVLLF